MSWLRRPPYLRWITAVLIVAGAVAWEVRAAGTSPHPFVAADVTAGTPVEAIPLEWRALPRGALPAPPLTDARAVTDLAAGEPLLPALLRRGAAIPDGWWSVAVPLAPGIPTGTTVLVVDTDTGTQAPGVVTGAAVEGLFGATGGGLVAVPGDRAAEIAAGAAQDRVVVLVAP